MNYLPMNFLHDIPKIYEQQRAEKKYIYAKYYIKGSAWSWNILEYSKLQKLFYGYIEPENTLGYFTRNELLKVTHDYEVKIELKNYLLPKKLSIERKDNGFDIHL